MKLVRFRRQSVRHARTVVLVTVVVGAAAACSGASSDLGLSAGVWEGVYACPQGETGLVLTVFESQPDDSTVDADLRAVFRFFDPTGARVIPTGEFSMEGSRTGDRLVLVADDWILRPEVGNYVTVDLQGELVQRDDVTRMNGEVLSPQCSSFSLERTRELSTE